MSGINSINAEIDKFKNEVKRLSGDVASVGINWHDDKYAQLSSLISTIANNSKGVISSAEDFSADVKRFQSLSDQG
ncbi:MAG: hypothetical protein IJQ07_06760 [Clostridia bacterium]|nr:hypothetical protein [Clostridia bacterium]